MVEIHPGLVSGNVIVIVKEHKPGLCYEGKVQGSIT